MKCGASDIDELYDLMIKEARNLYMKEMGILFGGLTQTNYIDEMIRKCFNTSSALEILESNKTKISDDEYKSIKDANLTKDEIQKLNNTIKSCLVNFTHMQDIREQMAEMIGEVSDELEIKPAEIRGAAQTLFKQNLAQRRQKQKAVEEILEILGYDVTDDE